MLKFKIFTTLTRRNAIPLIYSKMKIYMSPEEPYCRVNRKFIEMYESMLVKHLDIDLSEASSVVKRHHSVLQVPPDQVIKCCSILETYKVDVSNIAKYGYLLKLQPSLLEQRILVFLELGMPVVTVDLLGNFFNTMKISVFLFKAYANIDSTVDISENLFNYLHQPRHEIPPMEKLSEDMSLNDYRLRCIEHYLCWILKLGQEDVRQKCINLKLTYKSFKLFKETLTLLQCKIGFGPSNIDKIAYLVRCNSKHIEELIDKVEEVSDINIANLIKKYPRILDTDIENIISTLKLLKDYNVPHNIVEKCPEIFLLPIETLSQNLQVLNTTKFNMTHNYLQILQSIAFNNLDQTNMKYLSENDMKWISFRKLVEDSMKEHERSTYRKRIGVFNTIDFLKRELLQDEKEIRHKIARHPYWHYIPLTVVQDTLQFLKVSGFSIQDIYKSLHITLYPRYKVKNALGIIKEENSCDKLTPTQCLNLCVYEIEREFHFSGDGVWSKSVDKYDDFSELSDLREESVQKEYSETIKVQNKQVKENRIMNNNLLSSY